MHVEGWQWISRSDPSVDTRAASQEREQGRRTRENHRARLLLDQRGVADELQRIAVPLLGMQQDGLAHQGRTIPEWFRELPRRQLLGLPAPFVFRPALLI